MLLILNNAYLQKEKKLKKAMEIFGIIFCVQKIPVEYFIVRIKI